MTSFADNPEVAAAELIARLPEGFGELDADMVSELGEAHRQIAEAVGENLEQYKALLGRMDYSVGEAPAQVATEAERAEFDGIARRGLALERAAAAMTGYLRSARAADYGLPASYFEEGEPMWIEEPDGTIVVRLPSWGGES